MFVANGRVTNFDFALEGIFLTTENTQQQKKILTNV